MIRKYLDSAGITAENNDRPLFRSMTCSSWPGVEPRTTQLFDRRQKKVTRKNVGGSRFDGKL